MSELLLNLTDMVLEGRLKEIAETTKAALESGINGTDNQSLGRIWCPG